MVTDQRAERGAVAVVAFIDDEQDAWLHDVVVAEGTVSGLRWKDQIEEGYYSYPLARVFGIKWESTDV